MKSRTLVSILFVAVATLSCRQHAGHSGSAPGKSELIYTEPNAEAAAYFEQFDPEPAPKAGSLLLKKGDRLAICGDSITEQKMYSRIMETYLAVCRPDLEIATRQFGWGGEKADGFLRRMTNDVLRFDPDVATTCYGMNDHLYRAYEPAIGKRYREYTEAIVDAFEAHDVKVVLGSPGCVGKRPGWSKDTNATTVALNKNLCTLRNIDVAIAREEDTRFADVFWPMLTTSYYAEEKYGPEFDVAGEDGVHPGWAGHVVMAYAFLKALGLNGEIGAYTVDLKSGQATVSEGHELISFQDGQLQIKSSRYPFCATNTATTDQTIRAGMTLVPFNRELNRLTLRVKHPAADRYKVTWGSESKTYSRARLTHGINLAEEFPVNPFWEAFHKVDEAVAAKQAYETGQIKKSFRSAEAKQDMEGVVKQTEAERAKLVAAIHDAFHPVTHTVRIEPAP